MKHHIPSRFTRRCFTAGALLCSALPASTLPAGAQSLTPRQPSRPDSKLAEANAAIAALETRNGGRLGVAALDTGSGRRIRYRAEERFAMCSTHKFLTVAAILTKVDHGAMKLNRPVSYSREDLLEYAPVTREHVQAGFMTVGALCAAAIEWSDNTAANLLLRLIGGPSGWTRYARSIGDDTSRLDRVEPQLNTAIPGDLRDTTTPDAMVHDLSTVLLGRALSGASRERLQNWMLGAKINARLLRARLPNGWRAADKSGSGENATRNDIGIILPPEGAPISIAVYYTKSLQPLALRENLIAETGRIVAETFA